MLPAVDAALIDGDHNWFTVHHGAGDAARRRPRRGHPPAAARPARRRLALRAPRPLLRRPSGSPQTSASPSPGGACCPDTESSSRREGSTPSSTTPWSKGGPRNGVRTALEDFAGEPRSAASLRDRPDLLRSRAGRRAGAARHPAGARGVARPSGEHRDASRADRAGGVHPTRRADPAPGIVHDAQRARGARRAPLPRSAQAGATRRTLFGGRAGHRPPGTVPRHDPHGGGRGRPLRLRRGSGAAARSSCAATWRRAGSLAPMSG